MTPRLCAALLMGVCAAFGVGCADPVEDNSELRCDAETRADVYAPDMIRMGDDGVLRIRLIESIPGPPEKGDNHFTVELLEADADVAIPDADMSVTPFMPDHNHGTPIAPVVTTGAKAGQYEIDRLNLWMPGLWEVRIDIDAQGSTDQVVFSFCVEG